MSTYRALRTLITTKTTSVTSCHAGETTSVPTTTARTACAGVIKDALITAHQIQPRPLTDVTIRPALAMFNATISTVSTALACPKRLRLTEATALWTLLSLLTSAPSSSVQMTTSASPCTALSMRGKIPTASVPQLTSKTEARLALATLHLPSIDARVSLASATASALTGSAATQALTAPV